jgi:tetratricopeptide (TPR) repeat protein
MHYAFDGRFELARRAIDWVLSELEASDGRERLPDLYVSARGIRETVLALADDLDAAERSAVETCELAARIPNRTIRSMTASALGQIHLMRGEYAEARRWAEESLEIAEAISNLTTLPAAAAVALLAHGALGEPVAAERYLAAIDEGLTASSSPQLNVRFIGDALLSVGDVDRARRYAERLRDQPVGGRLREVLVATALGDIAARLGRVEEADGCYRRAMGCAEAIGARSGLAVATLGAAELAAAAGTPPPTVGQLEQALAIVRTLRLERYRPRLERVMAGSRDALAVS